MSNSAISFNTAGLASASSPGLVGTGAQTFAGAKTFQDGVVSNELKAQTGSGLSFKEDGNTIIASSTDAGLWTFGTNTSLTGEVSSRLVINNADTSSTTWNGLLKIIGPTGASPTRFMAVSNPNSDGNKRVFASQYAANTIAYQCRNEATDALVLEAGKFTLTTGIWYQGNNSTTWSTTSDIRIKENIRDVNDGLEKILALHPVHFEYKWKPGHTKTGFIAQEFETVLPGHVHEQNVSEEQKPFLDEGVETIKAIDADLIPYLVKAIQELKAEIEVLKNQLNP